jgi:hypothetical protein
MFVRALFLLLLALDIGSACWIAYGPAPRLAAAPAADRGVARLVLLSERERGTAAVPELAAAPETPADRAGDSCRSIGPFPSQSDLRAAMNRIAPLAKRTQSRETHTTASRGDRVFLPAFRTREEALAAARALAAKGVRDYYVVTAGDQQNTVSLGLFRDHSNAERRRAEIAALGFTPQVGTRTEDVPEYWLDFAVGTGEPLDWQAQLVGVADLREQPIDCF